jgi:glycosyltransferase involved in cell wall biosynthesis
MKSKSHCPLSLTLVQRATKPDSRIQQTLDARIERGLSLDLFIEALERNGLPTRLIKSRTKLVAFPLRTAGQGGTRGIVSPRFLVDLVRSRTPFVICSEYGFETFLTLLVTRLLGRRTLIFQEHVGRGGVPLSPFDTRYRRLIGRLANGFVANTAAARDEIVRLLCVDPAKVFHVNHVVPPDRHQLCREPLSIEPPRYRPLFLYAGRLIRLKNVETVLRAARLLREEGREFEVWICGEGPDRTRLTEMTGQLGLDDVVRFIGAVAYWSIGHLYETCDVFIMPSNRDYRSVAVLEAMRFGKPVIDSALDGNAHDSARDRINALIFDPQKPWRLADCMREFVVSPGLAREMGARSEVMMEEYTPNSAALGLITALRRMQPAVE